MISMHEDYQKRCNAQYVAIAEHFTGEDSFPFF